MERLPRETPVLLLGAALAAAAAVTLAFTWHTTFFADTWDLLINRRSPGIDVLLRPHNEHLIVFPILINELFLRLFGMTSQAPELILLVAFLSATAALVFTFVERRAGSWPALFAAVLILFLGPAYEVLLWPFEITFIGPMVFGLAALLALERGDRRGDLLACLCLVLGLGFSSLGVPFLVGGAVAVFLGPRRAWLSRAYVWLVPLVLFAIWYVGWGHDAETHMTLHNVLASPAFVVNAIAVAVGSVTGLGTETNLTVDVTWGKLLALALLIGAALWWRAKRLRIDRAFWPVLAVALVNWFLTAFNAFPGREPTSSRYQYVGAIFVLLLLSCLLGRIRSSRNWVIATAVLVACAVGPNLVVLHEASKGYEKEAVITRSDTAALEIASRTVTPNFELSADVAGTGALVNVYAKPYLEAVREYGSPAYSLRELEAAPEEGRRQADVVLAEALPISVRTRARAYQRGKGSAPCVTLSADSPRRPEVRMPFGLTRIEVAPGPPAEFALRRFAAAEYPVRLESAVGDSATMVRIPRDKAGRPWYLHVEASQAVRVCRGAVQQRSFS